MNNIISSCSLASFDVVEGINPCLMSTVHSKSKMLMLEHNKVDVCVRERGFHYIMTINFFHVSTRSQYIYYSSHSYSFMHSIFTFYLLI